MLSLLIFKIFVKVLSTHYLGFFFLLKTWKLKGLVLIVMAYKHKLIWSVELFVSKKRGLICGISSWKGICLWGQKGKTKVFISSSSDLQIRKFAVFELEMFTELVSFITGASKYVLVDQKTNWKGDALFSTVLGPWPTELEGSIWKEEEGSDKKRFIEFENRAWGQLQLINVMHRHKAKY